MSKISFFILTVFLPIIAFADSATNAKIFGIWTLIPPVVAIALAFITKDVILSLFIGVFSGTFLINIINENVFMSFIKGFTGIVERVVGSMADSWNAGIMLQVLCIGGVVALITKMGGTKAVALWLSKKAKTGVSAQISTWLMGIFVFFDDYANALIVGPIMRPITDKFKLSREKLAFIIDATAAPIAGIAIISTWVGLEISLIKDGYGLVGVENINSYGVFIETIPYRFYNLFMLFFIVCTAVMQREYGPMLLAEQRARRGELHSGKTTIQDIEDKTLEPKDGVKLQVSNAVVPLLVLIIGAFISFYFSGLKSLEGEALEAALASPFSFMTFRETFGAADASVALFQSALFASIVAITMGVWRKIFDVKEAIGVWVKGWKTMIITIVILLLAWSLSSVIKELGTSRYLVDMLSQTTPKFILPVAIFILGSFISFSTGTSYGTMGILMPLAIPLANAVGLNYGLDGDALHAYMIVNISAVLTGAIFGDHCSPISDTTILSSMGAGCNHIDHVSTQIIYALSVGAVAIFVGYLPTALGASIWVVLPLGFLATWALVRFVGKKVEI
ncbi:Na+/H+ antiporter NhaC family protein [Campylobacter sp. RM9344]|uniref:Na+/H+ antiporter NhaC family protein n=1 Tax=Campylobacter californiensis TaxID=1032243 RepID=A0AAW3ZU74_9BACT|nr:MULTISPECIES: Na+/H+ antiporter NhaC family protein [unclassified Campylobacter]MBE2985298.1 Na+/H+ antiporter NhaC family protein [Campylobacter sp. RM6883]MBE2987136.1 Na+/H+ antiporter NhaC family protein [Campylobacter sp. RM12919]MBE2988814.1 Na+/H+ antiporter NhaC family protein [Campylobacter sp. RM12920]MBE2995939.1 Na+/H+ antiporter NhaC family protein [Campylobacter sp. RM6913]MBE3030052.1 Na+/H+ antiporter NhaC family protein [Campylobacter sp. RM9344]